MTHLYRLITLSLLAVLASPATAATVSSTNFIVSARRKEVAAQVARYAEYYRKTKAQEWLGRYIPDWTTPCTVEVKVTLGGAGGATSFAFDDGQILSQQMVVEGPLDRILESVLPHEITHTIFAAKFRRPLPRWADEGGAVLSEDYQEISRHDLLVRKIINRGGMIPLRRLFVLTEYPNDVMALYAQGFSVARYLTWLKGRQHFLDFVMIGQQQGWDYAVSSYYGFGSVQELEYRWIEWLRAGRGTGADGPVYATRQPQSQSPTVVRGQIPDDEPARRRQQPAVAFATQENQPSTPALPPRQRYTGSASRQTQWEFPAADQFSPSAVRSSASAADKPRPARRLIPIAVGRTRRSHHPPVGG